MRSVLLLLIGAATAFPQSIGFGLKGGIPFTDFTKAVSSGTFHFDDNTRRYIVGPTFELRLPFSLAIEVDALYRRFNYNQFIGGTAGATSVSTSGNAWEFPLLAKYRFHAPIARPYLAGGVAWDTLSGLTQSVHNALASTGVISSSHPNELNEKTTMGFVLGGGLDVKVLFIHVSPEIRYTRWGAKHFLDPNGGLSSNQNQAEFLVGITF
ncbi:MAG TPA: outer membrane beta-barrel protein [Chthoniobacterales bacterium]|nr:outer membrane beta-barrel protein [Chthoniobacterales bacterium]